jgi:hypothetical protein
LLFDDIRLISQNVRRISASKDNPEDLHSDIDGAGLARVDEIDESDDERSQNSGGASIFDSDDEKEDSQVRFSSIRLSVD